MCLFVFLLDTFSKYNGSFASIPVTLKMFDIKVNSSHKTFSLFKVFLFHISGILSPSMSQRNILSAIKTAFINKQTFAVNIDVSTSPLICKKKYMHDKKCFPPIMLKADQEKKTTNT